MDAAAIIDHFYPEDCELKRLLWHHSCQVRDKALAILAQAPAGQEIAAINRETVINGALLHDIGIGRCDAPGIYCTGKEPYLAHGTLGAQMLREYSAGQDDRKIFEVYARICERHTGSGITAEEIRDGALPLPVKDFLPETYEEKLICLADKFFSKSGNLREKPLNKVIHSMEKFGPASLARFRAMGELFGIFA